TPTLSSERSTNGKGLHPDSGDSSKELAVHNSSKVGVRRAVAERAGQRKSVLAPAGLCVPSPSVNFGPSTYCPGFIGASHKSLRSASCRCFVCASIISQLLQQTGAAHAGRICISRENVGAV